MAGRPIDEKIVVMKLDNSDFANKAADTTNILGKMRDALNKIPGVNLGKTSEELAAIDKAASTGGVDRLGNAAQAVGAKFSAMSVVAITALANITNRAVDAGLAMAKGFTIQPIMDGFGEYEKKIGSIQTILANTKWAGTNLDDVNKALNELNLYADQTIYSFSDMTTSIGTFTAAGVKLDDATTAIKGMSNLAAASGSNVEQLNSAMYQMSQAMASGKIGLEDWNSLVNSGMGGKMTQDALLATAKAMGKNVDMSKGFRMSLQQGWLTTDVFLAAMQKFGKDQSMIEAATKVRTFTAAVSTIKEAIGSGWANTWEIVFGNFNQATELWSGLTSNITKSISDAANKRNELMKSIADKGGFTNIFTGIENAIKPVLQIAGALKTAFQAIFPPKTADQIVKMTESFKNFTASLTMSSDTVSKVTTVFKGIFAAFDTVRIIAVKVGKAFLQLIPPGVGGGILDLLVKIANLSLAFNETFREGNDLTRAIDGTGSAFGALAALLSSTGNAAIKVGQAIMNGLGKAITWIKGELGPIGDTIKKAFSGFSGTDVLGAGTLLGIGLVVKKVLGLFDDFGTSFGSFKDFVKEIGDGVSETIGGLGDALQAFVSQVKYNNLMKIAISIGLLAVSLKILEGMSIQDITHGIVALGLSMSVMMGAMMVIDKFNITGGMRASANLIALSIAVDIMASSLKKISDLKPEELQRSVSGLIGVTATLTVAVIAMSKLGGKMGTSSLQLIALAGTIYILVDAIDKMSSINSSSLLKSVGALGIIFAEIAVFLKVADNSKIGIGSALGLIAVAGAIQMMVDAIQKIATINVKELIKGLGTIAIILGEIAIFSKVVSGPTLIAAGVGMLIVAGAIAALVPSITTLGNMTWEQLAKGLLGMAVALAAVAGAALLASGSIGGAVAITIMAGALALLMIPMKDFANMSWEGIAKGLVGLVGALVLVAGAAALLSPLSPAIAAFGGALLLVGAAALATGAGIALFAVGLTTLATLTAASVAAIVSALGLLLAGFATLIPAAVDFVVKLGLALIQGLLQLVPALVNAAGTIIVSILQGIATYLPQFIDLGGQIIVSLIDGLSTQLPKILDAAVNFVVQLISGMASTIRDHGPELIGAMMELMGELVILIIQTGVDVINALFGWIPGVSSVTTKIGQTATDYIRNNFKASDVGSQKGSDFANSLGSKTGAAQSAATQIANAGKTGANSVDLASVGYTKGLDFANGIGSKSGNASSSGKSLANAGKSGAESVSMNSSGSWFGQGFADGIASKMGAVTRAAQSLASKAKGAVEWLLDINSPSKVMRENGGWFGEGFALGIDDKQKRAEKSGEALAKTARDATTGFLDAFTSQPVDNEIHFKAVVDYDKLNANKFGTIAPLTVTPDVSTTTGLVTAAKAELSQNGSNNPSNVDNSNSTVIHQQNTIQVEAKGYSTRAEIKKLAVQIQDELKNLNDRTKISRGEGVAF
jgi:tape measure domain-containing protein